MVRWCEGSTVSWRLERTASSSYTPDLRPVLWHHSQLYSGFIRVLDTSVTGMEWSPDLLKIMRNTLNTSNILIANILLLQGPSLPDGDSGLGTICHTTPSQSTPRLGTRSPL